MSKEEDIDFSQLGGKIVIPEATDSDEVDSDEEEKEVPKKFVMTAEMKKKEEEEEKKNRAAIERLKKAVAKLENMMNNKKKRNNFSKLKKMKEIKEEIDIVVVDIGNAQELLVELTEYEKTEKGVEDEDDDDEDDVPMHQSHSIVLNGNADEHLASTLKKNLPTNDVNTLIPLGKDLPTIHPLEPAILAPSAPKPPARKRLNQDELLNAASTQELLEHESRSNPLSKKQRVVEPSPPSEHHEEVREEADNDATESNDEDDDDSDDDDDDNHDNENVRLSNVQMSRTVENPIGEAITAILGGGAIENRSKYQSDAFKNKLKKIKETMLYQGDHVRHANTIYQETSTSYLFDIHKNDTPPDQIRPEMLEKKKSCDKYMDTVHSRPALNNPENIIAKLLLNNKNNMFAGLHAFFKYSITKKYPFRQILDYLKIFGDMLLQNEKGDYYDRNFKMISQCFLLFENYGYF